jgi:hypothetical protein
LVKIRKKSVLLSECSVGALAETALWLLPEGLACAVGAIANVPFAGRHKIELKKCAVGKIKNTEGSAMSVGLLVVLLIYGLYVGHLSKWFTICLSFGCLVNVRSVVLPFIKYPIYQFSGYQFVTKKYVFKSSVYPTT